MADKPASAAKKSSDLSLRTIILPIVAIVLLIAYFSYVNPLFFSSSNALNIGRQSSVLLMVALAGTVVILIGSIDLSVGALVTLTGILAALTVDQYGLLGATLVGVGVGALVGLVNGSLVTMLRVPSFLVTLGMLSILSGVSNQISQGQSILFTDSLLPDLVNGSFVLGVPNVIWFALIATGLLTVVAFRTKLGRYLYALGGGEIVASHAGVPVTFYKILAFMLAGAICGLAGVMLTGQVGAGTPTAGSSLLLNSIAAVVMGGTALSGGIGGPHRTFLGVLVIAILTNGMDVTEVNSFTQDIVKGFVIILAVSLTIDRSKYLFIK
ncbi:MULTISPECIES: ABC transporter permease [unclassified Mesorhizobium]|jgi:ribose transport system permease protein/putative xylitol transport system permease protein|uniref:ABC transporter permease n=1 Tax=unclassified Mesorhizobium TaxID=325217 RepID=UPI000A9A893D|nr:MULTISPECIES: ABC transporter permease [unclassified Mesorhizobium]MBN9257966.1 ABC transporter permease [Mesorhizobium sp.]MBN9271736.1 ABC transporter permease [Mesorhizobium sp.]